MKYGIQLYSVRDVAKIDFEGALRQVAEMGYDMVETAGFFGYSAYEVNAMLESYGLTVCSTHTGYMAFFHDFDNTVAYHKAIGCKDIILPAAPIATKDELEYTIANINKLLPLVEKEGMKLHFHNHSKEFLPNCDGLIPFDELAKRTDIRFELDTFWAFNAGLDPIEIMEQYKDRIEFIHLKDGIAVRADDPESKPIGKSVGSGEAPVEAVRLKAIELGLNVVVESEGLDPTGPEEVKRCIDFLRALDAKDGN